MDDKIRQSIFIITSNDQQQMIQALGILRQQSELRQVASKIAEFGGIEALVDLINQQLQNKGASSSKENQTSAELLIVLAAEIIACVIADDVHNRDYLLKCGGLECVVNLLCPEQTEEVIIRALLITRILSDQESDRLKFINTQGIQYLVYLLDSGYVVEVTEYAAAALGNFAAGSQKLKTAIREAGGIPPLVKILKESPQEISAELAAVVLRNLALQNPLNREIIVKEEGLDPLINLLSVGQEHLNPPQNCAVVYQQSKGGTGIKTKELLSICAFDTRFGHLCIATQSSQGPFAALQGKSSNILGLYKDYNCERYSLLRKLMIHEHDVNTLVLNFAASYDGQGVVRVMDFKPNSKIKCVERVIITQCNASELKGCIMRLLTRLHLEQEFKIGKFSKVQQLQRQHTM